MDWGFIALSEHEPNGSTTSNQWLQNWCMHLNIISGFGQWAVSGESGAEGGGERLADRSQSATPAAEPQTEARRRCGDVRMPARDERAV